MSIRLYMDEDSMDQRLATALCARGLDVQTALDPGMIERPDENHLMYAADRNRVLYSFNVADFHRLHTLFVEQERAHAGVALAQQQRYTVVNRCDACSRWQSIVPLRRCKIVSRFFLLGSRRELNTCLRKY